MSTCSTRVLDHATSPRPAVSYGYDRIRFVKPVRVGDTVTVTYEIVAADARGPRPRRGDGDQPARGSGGGGHAHPQIPVSRASVSLPPAAPVSGSIPVEQLNIAGDDRSAGRVAEPGVTGRSRVFARAGALTHLQNRHVRQSRQIRVDELELEWILALAVDAHRPQDVSDCPCSGCTSGTMYSVIAVLLNVSPTVFINPEDATTTTSSSEKINRDAKTEKFASPARTARARRQPCRAGSRSGLAERQRQPGRAGERSPDRHPPVSHSKPDVVISVSFDRACVRTSPNLESAGARPSGRLA